MSLRERPMFSSSSTIKMRLGIASGSVKFTRGEKRGHHRPLVAPASTPEKRIRPGGRIYYYY
jgi:hypothetical protein